MRDGTYNENVYVNKDYLTIKSEEGAASTIVQAENQDAHVFWVTADYVNISGFTVEGATGAAGIILNVNDDYCTISNNDIVLNEVGILLQYSSHNTVINNNINSNQYGIWLYKSGGNMITNNNINSNHRGIYMRFSYDNKIIENTFKENAEYGLYMLCYKDYDYVVRCNGRNKIYHNNFVDNFLKPQMYASDSLDQNLRNYLDDGYPSGGNYWSDYAGDDLYGGSSQDQPGSDGIGDTPYISHDFYGGYLHDGYCLNPCQDGYPLMNPWTPSEPDTTPPTVTTVSPQNGAPDVAIDTVVTATFSEAMDSSTITTDSFTLAGSAVSGTVTYDSDTYTATFTPDADLEYNHEYTATLSTAITDKAGNPLAEAKIWSFTTQSGPVTAKILPVPYYSQDGTDWCVPTSMSMIFKYYDKPIHSWDIAESWGRGRKSEWWWALQWWPQPEAYGVRTYFNDFGLTTKDIKTDDFESIKDSIDNDIPVFLSVSKLDHAVVVVGYKVTEGSDIVYINDPSDALKAEGLVIGERERIAAEVDWNELTKYLGLLSYAIAIDGNPSYPKGTIDINDMDYGFYFHHEGKLNRLYSWRCGKDGGIILKPSSPLHPPWLDQRDVFKFDRDISNHMEDKQSYLLEIEFAKEGYSVVS